MKKLLISLTLLVCSVVSHGQQFRYNISGTTNKRLTTFGPVSVSINPGEKVLIQSFMVDPVIGNCYLIKCNDINGKIAISELKKIDLDLPVTREELWKHLRINSDTDPSIITKGLQLDLRKELEDETIEALQNFEKYYGFFDDEYLEDYIQSLFHKIHPINLSDGRPGSLSVRVLKLSSPNAYCMPTGTIILTTGMLSTIRSEDELIGILAHEVAHFVLDHQVVNINKAITRQKRAEFWAGFATAVAAATEVYLSAKYDYAFPGSITLATAGLSTSIANSISERVGTNYSIEQESEADNAAIMILKLLNRDPKSFSAALTRIQNYCTLNGDYFALSASGTHPSLSDRIIKIGEVDPDIFNDTKYDKIISFVNTFNSFNEYGLNHLESAINLANRNIDVGVAAEDDYIIKAMAIRSLSETPEKIQEALHLIKIAKGLDIAPTAYLYKQEGITLLRLRRQKEAQDAFKTYLEYLESEKFASEYILNEIDWTKKMIHKVSLL